jgi:hypothetical protein
MRRAIGMGSNAYAASGRTSSLNTATSKGAYDSSRLTPSPTQDIGISTSASAHSGSSGLAPRRSASDAAFWKSKRGAKDWGATDGAADEPERVAKGAQEQYGEERDREEGEWDVESAAQNRVVQVMFTVPRERLRVVNADQDTDARSLRSARSFGDRADENWV